jgi:UDP:flavonoid glycosyltransferase YjiC (YdhE family)
LRYLFTTLFSNDLGCPVATLPVAAELARRGHDVAFCSPRHAPAQLINDAGLSNLPYSGPKPTILSPPTKDIWNIDHLMAQFGYIDDTYVRAACDNLMKLISECQADVIVDSWNLAVCLAARILRKRLVTILQADMHPESRGFIWWREPPSHIPSPASVLNTVLAEHGLHPVSKSNELFIGDLTLVSGTPQTDPLPARAEVIYVGPLLWQKPDATLPEWIGSLDRTKPLIWIYTGNPRYASKPTIGDSNVVLRASVEALAGMDIEVVLTTGYQPLPDGTPAFPDHFHFTPYVPGLTMASRCDLMIHHGGHESCLTGLYSGTPAFIVPTFSERESNARRVAALGAGDFLVPEEDGSGEKHLSAGRMRKKVNRLLSDSAFTLNARRVSEDMRRYGGARLAANLIEEIPAEARP